MSKDSSPVYIEAYPEGSKQADASSARLDDGRSPFSSSGFWRGVRSALPIVLGYVPVAFTFGVMAEQGGLSVLEAGLMGLLVFAGSGQLIAAGMILAGAGAMSIIITTFVVNLRHLLMSAAMAPYLRKWPKKLQAWFCYQMTDETFAMNISHFAEKGVDRDEALGIHAMAHFSWVSGGILGALFGDIIGDIRPYGLDYALAGMFVALLTPHLRIPRRLAAALLAAVLAVLLALNGVTQWNVIIATVCASTLGVFLPLSDISWQADKAGGDK